MKTIASILLLCAFTYALALLWMFLFQRSLLYFPTAPDPFFTAEEIVVENQGVMLYGWVLNPGRDRALIYFGGNSEMITLNRAYFEQEFSAYSIYLVNYRGYGKSQGKPSETALLADAVAIYDRLSTRHSNISLLGRSLGSGIAVYLATQRSVEKLILLTPYDSIAALAQHHYPLFPISWLIHDKFDSSRWAKQLKIPVLVITAEHDRVVPLRHSEELVKSLEFAVVSYHMVEGAAHNDVTEFAQYHQFLREFLAR